MANVHSKILTVAAVAVLASPALVAQSPTDPPAGHVHYRYRRPTRALTCGTCSRRFDPANAIEWVERPVARRRAS